MALKRYIIPAHVHADWHSRCLEMKKEPLKMYKMKIISTTEFRKQLSKYLGMAHNETVFISRKGKHMVMIIPVPASDVNTIIAKNNEDQRFTVTKKVR